MSEARTHTMMADEYRRRADEVLKLLAGEQDDDARAAFRAIAESWLNLAEATLAKAVKASEAAAS